MERAGQRNGAVPTHTTNRQQNNCFTDMENYNDKQTFIKEYCKALDEGRAAVFAGAGLSASAGFVNWAELLSDVAKKLGVKIDSSTNLVDLAQYYFNKFKNTNALSSAILNQFPNNAPPTLNHQILASLPIAVYWTTNFDKLIERSLEQAGKVYDVKSDPHSLTISKDGCNVTVYKMNGDVDHPTEAILTRDQFEQYPYTHQSFLNNFSYDLTNRTFLFLGLSFNDPNLKYVLKYVRHLYNENQREHYYILKKAELETGESNEDFDSRFKYQDLFIEDLKNYGIQTVLIDDYAEITEILTAIKERYLRKNVFISGAANDFSSCRYNEDEFKQFVMQLSADLISNGYRIVSGYGLGLGNEVLAGAISELNKLHKPMDGNLIIRPFPQGASDSDRSRQAYREEMISMTGVSLFLMGNKRDKATGKTINSPGVRKEYEISRNNRSILIPVGATGSMARELYNEQMKAILAGETEYDKYKKLFEILGDESLPLNTLRKKILELLNAINE